MIKKYRYIFFITALFFFFKVSYAKDGQLSVGGLINSSLLLNYIVSRKNWEMDYPMHSYIYINYKEGIMNIRGGLRYDGSLGIDELYIRGGDKYSYIKLGNFLESWNIAKSTETLMNFSGYDKSYPKNIFYMNNFLPEPTFKIAFSKNKISQELVISRGESQTDINNHIIGFKSSVNNENNSISLGVIRRIGLPPPNYFIQLKGFDEELEEWIEINYIYNKQTKDQWSALFGVEKQLNKSSTTLELLLNQHQNFIYTHSNVQIRDNIVSRLSCYLSINDWSSAWNTDFIFLINKNFDMRLGGIIFLGKSEKYFSPMNDTMENNDSLYCALEFNL